MIFVQTAIKTSLCYKTVLLSKSRIRHFPGLESPGKQLFYFYMSWKSVNSRENSVTRRKRSQNQVNRVEEILGKSGEKYVLKNK